MGKNAFKSPISETTRYRIVCQARPELHGWIHIDYRFEKSNFVLYMKMLSFEGKIIYNIYIYIYGTETSFQKTHVNSIHHFGPSITASKACTRCHQYEPDAIATLTGRCWWYVWTFGTREMCFFPEN